MTKLITRHTDPKLLMIDGHPEIEILGLNDMAPIMLDSELIGVYIKANEALDGHWNAGTQQTSAVKTARGYYSGTYYPDGTPNEFNTWPRLVWRYAFDLDKPLFGQVRDSDKPARPFKVLGVFTAIDETQYDYVLVQDYSLPSSSPLKIDRHTGRVCNGLSGSALDFFNEKVETFNAIVTTVNGEITNVERT